MPIMASLNFKVVWLEIRACGDGAQSGTPIERSELNSVPALSEVLAAAEKTNARVRDSKMWDYSRRLDPTELAQVMEVLKFSGRVEDERSVSLSINVTYGNSCYTLTLFAPKQ